MTKQEVLDAFKRTGGILKGHFILTSGRHSDTYMQCAKLFVEPAESEALCKALAEKLEKYNADLVISPAVGGIIMGYEVARQLKIRNIFAERENGKMTLRRGFSLNKERVVVVEDVVTTGGSVKEVIALAREAGCTVVAAASLVDRTGGNITFDCPFETLLPVEVISYEPENCPLCKAGSPAVKPGSRGLK
jgi:orotate phosphoribosyltransferase